MSDTRNPILSKIAWELRKSRPKVTELNHYTRIEEVPGGYMVDIWFRTRGCWHDRIGACTMCNYWWGPPTTAEDQIGYVASALASLSVLPYELLVSPSGSMLDPWEVPPAARLGIFHLIREHSVPVFLFETCAETVLQESVDELVATFDGSNTLLGVEIGLESSDPWILKYCVNKGLDLDEFTRAVKLLGEKGIRSYANISLGSAFLSTEEAIQDAEASVRWAFTQGTDACVVFPIHVKPHTVIHWLWQRGLYQAPSLWSLIEVLYRLGPELSRKVEISWHRSYYEEGEAEISASPFTCPACYDTVATLLNEYKASQDFGLILELKGISCRCQDQWAHDTLVQLPTLEERVFSAYRELAIGILGEAWWNQKEPLLRRSFQGATTRAINQGH